MTDDRADESETENVDSSQGDDGGADTDAGGSTADSETTKPGGLDTPGGGPRKVVSSTSVDDILESLNSTPKAEEPTTREPDAPGESGSDASSSSAASDPADDTPTELTFDEDETEDAVPDVHSLESEATPNDGTDPVDVDDAVSALRTHLEGDAVTGADVRAAEHGEGREKTPEIDEVDLSLEDLAESSSTASTRPTSSTSGSGDGPLAGRIDSEAPVHQDRTLKGEENDGETEVGTGNGDGESEDSTNEDDDSAGGLLGRLRGLFSR